MRSSARPGAGKTTALLNAGLHFPLAEEMGQGAVAGIGGTRLCDWWFTDEAVLIDTAGRYTTQDSDAQVDRAGWEAFLDLLRRTRKRQPLNGVLVAIAISDLARADEGRRAAHARAIRHRVQRARDAARCARAGLPAFHQGGPDGGLHRVLRRPRPRAARSGLGHHVSARRPVKLARARRSPPSSASLSTG